MANVTTEGATLDSLAQVGESLGFTTHGLQCTYQTLLGFELPFIAHWEGYHYIVVYGVSKNQVWVADPGLGFRKPSVAEFRRRADRHLSVVYPRADLAQIEATRSLGWFVRLLRPHKPVLGYLILATLVIQVPVSLPDHSPKYPDRVVVSKPRTAESADRRFYPGPGLHAVDGLDAHLSDQFHGAQSRFSMMSQFFSMRYPCRFSSLRRTGDIFARFQENQTIRQFLTQSTISTMLNLLMVFFTFWCCSRTASR